MKKFLTVLLALSVVFTYTVGTAFAAVPNPASTNAVDSENAFKEVVKEVKDSISYDGKGYNQNANEGAGYLSREATEARIDELAKPYIQAIRNASSNWDDAWSAVTTAADFKSETKLFDAADAAGIVEIFKLQYDIELKAANLAMAPDLSGYAAADKVEINKEIDKQVAAIEAAKIAISSTTTVDNVKDAIDAFKAAVKAVQDEMKKYNTATTDAEKLAQAKNDAIFALNQAADAFTDAVETAYKNSVNATEVARLASLDKDVDKMAAMYEEKIEEFAAKENMSTADKINALGQIAELAKARFAIANFYTDLTVLSNADVLLAYADTVAAEKKAAIGPDGTKLYDNTDVDVKLAEAKKAVNDAAYAVIATGAVAPTKTTVTDVFATLEAKTFPLAAYKKKAIKTFTEGKYATVNPAATAWSGDRYDKVVDLQDKASDEILLAETTDAIDAIAKQAVKDIDAILTDDQIDTLESKTDTRVNILGYNTAFDKYFDAVVGTTGYSSQIKADAIDAAKQIFKDAVVATENANITYAEIDKIIKDNYNTALAELTKAKTKTELATQATAVDTLINALPPTITIADKDAVLAAQKALEDYLDLPGTDKADISYGNKLKTAMATLINLESKAVKDQIKALPSTIAVADAEKVEAAKAALDALEATYGDYDGKDKFGENTGFAYVLTVAPSNAGDVKDALKALETAKLKDAADKVKALGSNPTVKEVKAARDAYDALKLETKLLFNDELYADLLKAEKAVDNAVKSFKIVASSKLYKGNKIRVKWRIAEGDVDAIDGYKVYKSTKAQSGYKYMGKTKKLYMDNKKGLKKGKRMYYRVRAYKVIDGKTYYSDYSNKANRIYK